MNNRKQHLCVEIEYLQVDDNVSELLRSNSSPILATLAARRNTPFKSNYLLPTRSCRQKPYWHYYRLPLAITFNIVCTRIGPTVCIIPAIPNLRNTNNDLGPGNTEETWTRTGWKRGLNSSYFHMKSRQASGHKKKIQSQ